MSALKSIDIMVADKVIAGTAFLSIDDDSVWVPVPLRWWDLATLLWWVFLPSDRQAKASLTLFDGKKVSVRLARVATKHVRIRGLRR